MSSNRFEAQMRAEVGYRRMGKMATPQQTISAPQCTTPVDTLTSLANEAADALVDLRAGITNLCSELGPVIIRMDRGPMDPPTTPQHSASALAQIQTLIEQINGARQDVQDMRDGLRV